MNDQLFQVPQGSFQLQRYPVRNKDPLRAWDAADELILQHLATLPQPLPSPLIVNDSFGALTTALAPLNPSMSSDSFIAHQALAHNLRLNGLEGQQVKSLKPFEQPNGAVRLLLIKVPKALALLEDQLYRLRPWLAPDCTIVAGAMAKHIHRSTLALFDKVLGPTHTSLAKKKARLIFSELGAERDPGQSPYPSSYPLENSRFTISNHAGVFSREKLDIGTRLFLQQLPASERPTRIIDLGCGNGVVGLIAADKNPRAELLFVDESYRALASAEENFHTAFGASRQAEFKADNCLEHQPSNSADLILNNPPFHQQQAVGDHIARQMFKDAKRVLVAGGELWVIGNRHLGYHVRLKQLFGNCELVASNAKFVVLRSIKG